MSLSQSGEEKLGFFSDCSLGERVEEMQPCVQSKSGVRRRVQILQGVNPAPQVGSTVHFHQVRLLGEIPGSRLKDLSLFALVDPEISPGSLGAQILKGQSCFCSLVLEFRVGLAVPFTFLSNTQDQLSAS